MMAVSFSPTSSSSHLPPNLNLIEKGASLPAQLGCSLFSPFRHPSLARKRCTLRKDRKEIGHTVASVTDFSVDRFIETAALLKGETWSVHKFGGTCVGTPKRIQNVAEIVVSDPSERKVIVVSAMSKVTDSMYDLIYKAQSRDDSYVSALDSLYEKHKVTASELLDGDALASFLSRLHQDITNLKAMLRAIYIAMHRRPFFLLFLLIVQRRIVRLSAAHPGQEAPPLQPPTVPDGWKLDGRPFNVVDYGAAGDGRRYDTKAIQAAVDACRAAGGGPVVLPSPGRYLTGTILLRSGVFLVVEKGARLLGSPSQLRYPRDQRRWYVVLAEGATDVGITGGGVIDGQGEKFVERLDERKNVMVSWNATGSCLGDECRPRLVGFVDCQNIRVWDVRLTQPAYWCLHIVRSNNTLIHDIAIDGDFNTPNNDGIDIEDSNNTIITRCSIDTGDDAICPKSSSGPVYNLSATQCWIRTKSSAIKLGSASWFSFKNFLFDNITIVESHRGLAFQIRDGGNASDIVFSNIKIETRYYHRSWWGRAEPIYITSCPRHQNSKEGSISNIKFINVSAVSENGAFLSGSAKGLLSDIEFINVNLTYRRWTNFDGGIVDYRPGCQGLVKHRTAGIIMEHISGLVTENLKMNWAQNSIPGWNTPLDFAPSTVNNIHLTDFQSTVL